MWRSFIAAILGALAAACAQLPPSPADIEAKRFQPVPDKAVIYVVRSPMDSDEAGVLMLDDRFTLTTLRGTYHRWEVDPGMHKIEGVGASGNRVTLNAAAGRIYYFVHTVYGTMRMGTTMTALQPINEAQGRALVTQSTLFP
ncbi:MAG: hypothetical protein EHM59_14765 [Betaproteobacteria bacterium]|nr:MAG: hypothetical protein EHM59_14765 [Betaproteobacteria bacterium]